MVALISFAYHLQMVFLIDCIISSIVGGFHQRFGDGDGGMPHDVTPCVMMMRHDVMTS